MSQSNFGLKIGVEGEKAFKQSLAEINQTFKVLGSEMQLVTSQFDKNDKSAAALTARNTVLNKEIDTQKDKVATLKSALDNASESFGENDKRTQNWQIQLNKAQAELNGMERELGENEKALAAVGDEMKDTGKETDKLGGEMNDTAKETDNMGGEMKDTGKEAGKLGDELAGAGKTADDAGGKFDKLGSVVKGVGIAIGAAMAAVGAASIAAGKAIYNMGMETAGAADRVDKASQRLGLSNQAYQEWDYVLAQCGGNIDSLGAGMKTLQRTMDGLTEDGDKSSEAFKKIGINFDDIKNKSPEEAFDMTVKALQNMPPGAEKTAAAMKLLGKQAWN